MYWQNIGQAMFPRILFSIDGRLQTGRAVSQCASSPSSCWMISEEEARQANLVWAEIREAAGLINRAGGNPVEILLWSRGKSLSAVREEIRRIVEGDRD